MTSSRKKTDWRVEEHGAWFVVYRGDEVISRTQDKESADGLVEREGKDS